MAALLELIRSTLLRADPKGIYFILGACAAVFLLVRGRGKEMRALGLYSVIAIALFFLPPTAYLAMKFMRKGDVYWRYLWLIPTVELIAAAATELITISSKRMVQVLTAVVLAAGLILGGSNLYRAGAFEKSTGREKLSLMTMQTYHAIEDNIAATGNTYAHLAAPQTVSSQLREVTSDVTLFTGRILNIEPIKTYNPKWYRNLVVLYGAKTDDEHKVVRSLKKQRCNYILMYSRVNCDEDLSAKGYEAILRGEDWNLWYNPEVQPKGKDNP